MESFNTCNVGRYGFYVLQGIILTPPTDLEDKVIDDDGQLLIKASCVVRQQLLSIMLVYHTDQIASRVFRVIAEAEGRLRSIEMFRPSQ